ncbi:GDSL-type esterase/lipase family protein [Quadrisphaera sp. GCM10027208]|uniref:GDSL-type esterase/lipase family protein n=1 Tax=Quadrisphaera sp. GCM10027208 TaxID=3273423 RepID=UPI0036152FF7
MSQERPAPLRICVVGDELVAGVGDRRALGWVGRVAARTAVQVPATGVFALGVPGESTSGLLARWREETDLRFATDADNRLAVGLGRADVDAGQSTARSRLNLANVLDDAESRGIAAFVLGPPPTLDTEVNARLGDLSQAFADVCQRRGVPFVDAFGPLSAHDAWFADLAGGDGTHPGQSGYGLLAWLVLHGGWHEWLGVPQDA